MSFPGLVSWAKRSGVLWLTLASLVLPLIVAAFWLYLNQRWAPLFDLALIEMRVRDVGTSNTPLLGLPGRLGTMQSYGSHPGPLAFYLLAPLYRLLGGTYWALRASTCFLNAIAIASAVLIARRRAGDAAVIGVGMLIALVELGFGLRVLTEPWNPHLPVLWFVLFLVSLWSVLDRDLAMLPVLAVSATFCAQTHIPYLAVCGALGLIGFVYAVFSWARTPRTEAERRRRRGLTIIATVVLTLLLWAPPVVEQIVRSPGNVTVLYEYFTKPGASLVGPLGALPVVLEHLDMWHIVVHAWREPFVLETIMTPLEPDAKRGLVFLIVWLLSAVLALRLEERVLIAAHAMVGAALLVGTASISRIIGLPWHYLTFWGWSVAAALLGATVATLAFAARRHLPVIQAQGGRFGAAVGVIFVAVWSLRTTLNVDRSGSSTPRPAAQLEMVVEDTAEALRRGVGAATGLDGTYLVTWEDAFYGGGQGLGLVNELERRGFRVRVHRAYEGMVTPRRVIERREATARVHMVTGSALVRDFRKKRGAVEIAFADPRSRAERVEFADLRRATRNVLRTAGRLDLVARFDRDLGAANVDSVHPFLPLTVRRMSEIGTSAAVFILKAKR